ncbi:hypothetical protein ABMA27_012528 [Loxostege sticticalis]|uniref:BED-type domain-containing protein n=1 Tax=Loxostege sticticalis TaxID=481309 RepID=A0ABR3GYV7_LOXSC
MEAESNDVWDYYEKCEVEEIGERRAKCRLCANIYNYSATIHNLKIHLARKHSISLGIQTHRSRSPKERRKRNTEVWSFFSRVEGKEKFASCHYCDKVLSYQTTTNNLKTHLRKQHPAAFTRMELAQQDTAEIEYIEEYLETDNEEGKFLAYFNS